MESGCEGVKGIFGVGNSLIVLLEVCNELVADIHDIVWPSGGGDCAGARAGGVKLDVTKLDNRPFVEPDILHFE
eukprot:4601203-Ditylum_brightwellii.AAC.1